MENTWIEKGSRQYKLALCMLFLGSIAAFGAEFSLQPVIPILAADFGLSPAVASLAMSCGTGGMAVAMLGVAALAPHLERKRTMVAALGISALFIIAMSFIESFTVILVLRTIQGILLAAFPALAVAYVNEEFSPKVIGQAIGVYVAATPIGGLAGRLLMSTIADYASWRTGLLLSGILYLLITVCILLLMPKPKNKKIERGRIQINWSGFGLVLKNPTMLRVFAAAAAAEGAFVCAYNFISYPLLAPPYSLSQTMVGLIFVCYLVGSVSSTVLGSLSDHYGHGKIMVLSGGIELVGILLTLGMPLWCKVAGIALLTFGFFGVHANACGWCGQLMKGDKAQASALYMFFYYMGASVLGMIGGVFLPLYGWSGVVGFDAVIVAVSIFFAVILAKEENTIRERMYIDNN